MARYDGMTFKRPQNIKETLGTLLHFLRGSRAMTAVATLSAAANGIISVIGTYFYKLIINSFLTDRDLQTLVRDIIILAVIYFIGAVDTLIYSQVMAKAAQKAVYSIRAELFSRVQRLPLKFFDTHSAGDVMSCFTNDVDTLSEALTNSYPSLVQSLFALLSALVMLFYINPLLTVLVLISQSLTFAYIHYATNKSRKYYAAQQKYLGLLNGFLEEHISGQKVVKVFNHEAESQDEFDQYNGDLREAAIIGTTYTGVMVPTIVSMSYLNCAIAVVGGGLLCIAGKLDFGGLTAFLICVRQAALPINQVTQQTTNLLSALAGAERIFGLLKEEPEVDDGTIVCLRDGNGRLYWHDSDPASNFADRPLEGDIRFDGITFGYMPGKTILHNISLHAVPDSKIAFVGSTGAGKTTIINLVNRFYEVSDGSIRYDGIDIRRIRKADLRRNIAIIVQTTHLFSGTIADNIRYSRPEATDEEVIAAAKLARADSFIRRLPDGYDTMLHNDGDNLSQGQRQLLSIARAAAARPEVLVLDEATSSIDTRTESQIEAGLDELMKNRTVLVIAHRLSTVRNSDIIMVIEAGHIIEQGSHDELIALGGRYAKLYTGQFELS